jgi:uncharacterized protein YpmS
MKARRWKWKALVTEAMRVAVMTVIAVAVIASGSSEKTLTMDWSHKTRQSDGVQVTQSATDR